MSKNSRSLRTRYGARRSWSSASAARACSTAQTARTPYGTATPVEELISLTRSSTCRSVSPIFNSRGCSLVAST